MKELRMQIKCYSSFFYCSQNIFSDSMLLYFIYRFQLLQDYLVLCCMCYIYFVRTSANFLNEAAVMFVYNNALSFSYLYLSFIILNLKIKYVTPHILIYNDSMFIKKKTVYNRLFTGLQKQQKRQRVRYFITQGMDYSFYIQILQL